MSQVIALTQNPPPAPPAPDALLQRIEALEAEVKRLGPRTVSNRATLIVFSAELDKVMAGLVIATGAAAMGLEVSMFHTFWGVNALRKSRPSQGKKPGKDLGKDLIEKALGKLMPAGIPELQPSQLGFAGAGARLLRARIAKNGVQTPEQLFELARELGVRFLACGMSMEVMGLRKEELVDGVEVAGVAAYLGDAADSKVTLFI